jgi:type IV secretion system protein VirD4
MTPDIDPYAYRRALARASGDGIYLGSARNRSVFASPERSVLALGPPRSGKTSCIVIPSILSATGPVVSTSTKPEVMFRTVGARSRAGETFLYDPTGTVERPDNVAPLVWSPVSACAQWSEAMLVAKLMVSASSAGASSSNGARQLDDHWHERAQSLIATLLHAASVDGASMSAVLKWVDDQHALTAITILKNAGNPLAADLLGGIAGTELRERSGIFSTASGVLGAYHSDRALATTNGEQFSAQEWAKTGGTVYICASARHQSLASPLVVGLLSEIRTACYEQASSHWDPGLGGAGAVQSAGRGAPPMFFALDEAANIAPLADLGQQLSEGGGQGLLTLVCLQDMSQARARWGPEAEGWFSLFGSKVIFPGIGDPRTLEIISALAGEEEVLDRSVSKNVPSQSDLMRSILGRLTGSPATGRSGFTGQNVTTSVIRIPRLTVDQVSKGKEGKALVLDERNQDADIELTPWFSEPWVSIVDPQLDLARDHPGDRPLGRTGRSDLGSDPPSPGIRGPSRPGPDRPLPDRPGPGRPGRPDLGLG